MAANCPSDIVIGTCTFASMMWHFMTAYPQKKNDHGKRNILKKIVPS